MPGILKISHVARDVNSYYEITSVHFTLGMQNSLKLKTLNCKKICSFKKKLNAFLNLAPQN